MTVREAKEIAADWVVREGSRMPGYSGAFFAGSINGRSAGETQPPGSDVDFFIVLDQEDTSSIFSHKFFWKGVVLESACFPLPEFRNPEIAVADYRVACHLAVPSIIADPSGILEKAHRFVVREYPRRIWIRKRCDSAIGTWIEGFLDHSYDMPQPLNLWLRWMFFGVTGGQSIALADLRDPTVKKSLVVSDEVLARYGESRVQELLLDVSGCRDMSAQDVRSYFDEYLSILNIAIECHKSPFPGENFVCPAGREVIIAGVREMIESGHHREVMAYLNQLALYALIVIGQDAPEAVKREGLDAARRFLRYFGISSEEEHLAHIERVRGALGELKATVERIIRANPRAID